MKVKIFIIIVIIIVGCKNKLNNADLSMNQSDISDKKLRELVLQKGDKMAYFKLYNSYLDYEMSDFLPYALYMANKYNYPQAYYDVYICLKVLSVEKDSFASIGRLDTSLQTMAISYLQKANDLGHCTSMRELGKLYIEGKYLNQNIEYGELLIKKAESCN